MLLCHAAGWVDDEPSRVTGRLEVRPAAELGPIIVCLDTSGPLACCPAPHLCCQATAHTAHTPVLLLMSSIAHTAHTAHVRVEQ